AAAHHCRPGNPSVCARVAGCCRGRGRRRRERCGAGPADGAPPRRDVGHRRGLDGRRAGRVRPPRAGPGDGGPGRAAVRGRRRQERPAAGVLVPHHLQPAGRGAADGVL
ncbi:MAG: hypothetical protein AVDCRST_MAG64-162, partial [uncultured Phycisphaerae bacterium]